MKNFKAEADSTLDYTNSGSAISAGDPVDLSDSVGVAIDDIANGTTGPLAMAGVFNLPAATGVSWSRGARVNLAAGEITSGAGTVAGLAYNDKSSGDTSCLVSINR